MDTTSFAQDLIAGVQIQAHEVLARLVFDVGQVVQAIARVR